MTAAEWIALATVVSLVAALGLLVWDLLEGEP